MKLVKKVLAGVAVAAAMASSAYATNITVGGVTWDPAYNDGVENDFLLTTVFSQWFTNSASSVGGTIVAGNFTSRTSIGAAVSAITGGAGGTGFYLQGAGEIGRLNDPANTTFAGVGYELTYAFGGIELMANGSLDATTAGWVKIFRNTTSPDYVTPVNTEGEVADAQDGSLWLEMKFGGPLAFSFGNVADGRVGAILEVTGGDAANNFDPYTLAYSGSARFNPGSSVSTGGIANMDGNTIPEPASLALVGLGLLGLAASRRRKSV